VRSRHLRSREFFSEFVGNDIAIGQLKEIAWHGQANAAAALTFL
jgi:hypothetical protein